LPEKRVYNMPFQRNCRVIEVNQIANGLFSLVFDCSDIAGSTKAGQFVHISCGDGLLLRRPISVCDLDGSLVRIIFQVKGSGTSWLSERKQGEVIDVLGPLGKGFALDGSRLLLVGGGIGVPPLLMAARQASEQGKKVNALLGFADADKVILLPEFASACDWVEVSTENGSLGKHGYVTDLLISRLEANQNICDLILSCGPQAMLSRVAHIAKEHHMPCQVSLEQRMGCGIGACLVCSCGIKSPGGEGKSFARVCADGPVFSSREVIWDET
jgi:dihydroorotate dehydrogenase electron transfer subunit